MKPRILRLSEILGLAAVYFLCGKFGLSLAFVNASATAVWPPTGVALAALLLRGWALWPGVFSGAFLVNITTQGSVVTSLSIASGNTLEALAGAWLVGRYANGLKAFSRARDVFRFLLLAAGLSTALSPSIGVTSLCLGGYARWEQYGPIWATWWLGDVVSDVIIAPALLIWLTPRWSDWKAGWSGEAAVLLLVTLLIGQVVFLGHNPLGAEHYPLEYLAIPPLGWAAFRFGARGAVTCAFLMSGLALWGTLTGRGPFERPDPSEALLLLQAFMGTVAVTALVLAAVVVERYQAEQARAHLAAIVQSSDDAIISEDLGGQITSWNEGARRMFLYSAEEMVGQSLAALLPPGYLNEDREILERIKKGERIDHYQTVRRRRDGSLVDVSLSVSPVKGEGGRIVGASKIARDITEQKRTERALAEARERLSRHAEELEGRVKERTAKLRDAMAELEQMSYSIVHDMRAPLRAIQGYAQMLQETCVTTLPAAGQHFLERMKTAAVRMDQLITDILAYSRMVREELPLTPVDVVSLIQGIVETYPELQSPKVRIRVEARVPPILGNAAALTQCFSNLLGNAAKFIRPGQVAEVHVRGEQTNGWVRIWVEDNGIGIPAELQERIFGMFQRVNTEYEGTGVGLAIVKKAVERLGGRVGVESNPGLGSRFWVELRPAEPA